MLSVIYCVSTPYTIFVEDDIYQRLKEKKKSPQTLRALKSFNGLKKTDYYLI